MSVTALVGGQFGSEGKGLIAGHLAKDFRHHVRVGAANAGHTVYTSEPWPFTPAGGERDADRPNRTWEKHVMQSIPCAAYANPEAELYVGPGALISEDIFLREINELSAWRRARGLPFKYVHVDPRAHVITQDQIEREACSDLAERIGSTSTIAREGIGVAQSDRILRRSQCVLAQDWIDRIDADSVGYVDHLGGAGFQVADVPMRLSTPDSILLEGTQGTGLSLTTGPFPYVTSRNTTAAGLCADAGIGPMRLDRVILVCRTYPIRVAGSSGPFERDSREIDWEDIDVDPETERTTVTKKVRRVATFSIEQVVKSAVLNSATEIALTFADYLDPLISGESGEWPEIDPSRYPLVSAMVNDVAIYTGIPVRYIGTGPRTVIHLRDDR